MNNKCIICVDGGGTKTEVVAYTLYGEEIERFIGGSGNLSVDTKQAIQNIVDSIDSVIEKVKDKYLCDYIQMGIAGYGSYKEKDELIEHLQNRFNTKVNIVDDAKLALYTILKENHHEGILVLAGTGSACYGFQNGKTLLVGGWGHLLGDEGSAYNLVSRTLKLMVDDEDNGLELKPLSKKILEHLKLDNVFDLKKYVYQNTKAEVAKNANFINQCAEKGDETAIMQLKQSGEDLANQAIKVYLRMKLSDKVLIGCQGSFILNSKIVNEQFIKQIKMKIPNAHFVENEDRPVKGAYYLAKRQYYMIDGDKSCMQ